MYFKQSVGCIGVIFLTGVLGLTGPQDTVQYVGSEATLNCSNNANEAMAWSDFNTIVTGNRIYISSSGLVGTHPNAGSYRVDKRTSNGVEHYNLNIISTRSTDAGQYGCKRTLLDSTFQRANLLVVDNFAVKTNKSAYSEFREGDSVWLECIVEKYGNVSKNPTLQWYDGNTILIGKGIEEFEGARTTFMKRVFKLLSSADNGKIFTCRMSFTASDKIVLPTGFTTEKSTGVMNVQYAPKVVNINPKQSGYFENDQVNCSATGNPTPSVTWSPSGSSTNGNGYSVLTIRHSMHGQAYTCAASNVIGYLEETLTIAVGGTDLGLSTGVGVGVAITILIIAGIGVYCFMKIRRKRENKTYEIPLELHNDDHVYTSIENRAVPNTVATVNDASNANLYSVSQEIADYDYPSIPSNALGHDYPAYNDTNDNALYRYENTSRNGTENLDKGKDGLYLQLIADSTANRPPDIRDHRQVRSPSEEKTAHTIYVNVGDDIYMNTGLIFTGKCIQ